MMLHKIMVICLILWPFCSYAHDTELKLYRPFGEVIQQAPVVVVKELAGECLQQSTRIKREDAWRCVAEGAVYDPCFVKRFGSQKQAVCPPSPWLGQSVLLNLSAPVDNSQHTELDMSSAYPWALELATGEKCQAIDKGETYDGLQVHYRCDSQTVLIGQIQRCKALWSILQKTKDGVSTVTVKKAWF